MPKAKKSKKAEKKKSSAPAKKTAKKSPPAVKKAGKKSPPPAKKSAMRAASQGAKIKPPKRAVWSSALEDLFESPGQTEYQAFCHDDNFHGSWQTDFNDEQQDEANHKAQPGCENHNTDYHIRQFTP